MGAMGGGGLKELKRIEHEKAIWRDSDCKNVQKSALRSVNVQRTGKSILQMFAFSFLKAVIFADFCLFCVPPPSLGVTLVTLKQRLQY
jgi:hypothetical protein